jgi:hypothetical protein
MGEGVDCQLLRHHARMCWRLPWSTLTHISDLRRSCQPDMLHRSVQHEHSSTHQRPASPPHLSSSLVSATTVVGMSSLSTLA